MADETLKPCKWCCEEIPKSAKVCNACNMHQQFLWNYLPNAPLLIALVAGITSATTFIISQSISIIDKLTFDERVIVLKLDSIGVSIIKNDGEGTIVVSQITMAHPDFSYSIEVDEIIEPQQITKITPPISIVAGKQFEFLTEESDAEPDALLFFTKGSSTILSWKNLLSKADKTLVEKPAECSVSFYSPRSGRLISSSFDCVCIPVLVPDGLTIR